MALILPPEENISPGAEEAASSPEKSKLRLDRVWDKVQYQAGERKDKQARVKAADKKKAAATTAEIAAEDLEDDASVAAMEILLHTNHIRQKDFEALARGEITDPKILNVLHQTFEAIYEREKARLKKEKPGGNNHVR